MKRTHLPLNGLRVFDAAARHLSFTRAADELAVTPAAVGQQIRALEEMLGVVLFRRDPKGLILTPEGEAGLDSLRSGFLMFEEAVRAMQAGQASTVLTIAAPRDVTAKWLNARLSAHAGAHPETRFHLIAADAPLDFTEANVDLAIRWAEHAGEHEGVAIDAGGFVSVTAPGAAAEGPRIGWPGCPSEASQPGVRVADAGLAIDAAIAGLGTATVPALLAEADLAAGRLSQRGEMPCTGQGAYWLLAPLPQWRQQKVRALVRSLVG